MENAQKFKERVTYVMLGITVAWAAFAVWVTYRAMVELEAVNVLSAAGASVLLGAMINWTGNVIQFWFRKSKTTEEGES